MGTVNCVTLFVDAEIAFMNRLNIAAGCPKIPLIGRIKERDIFIQHIPVLPLKQYAVFA